MTVDHHYRLTQQAPTAPPVNPSAPPPPGPPPGASWPAPPAARRRPQIVPWLALIVAVAALVAVIIDIAIARSGSQEPAPPAAAPATPTYTTEQIDAAKQQTCTAAERSIAGVRVATNRPGPNGPEDLQGQLNTALARTAILHAATYLPTQIRPETPTDLRQAAEKVANYAGDAISAALTEGQLSSRVPDNAYRNAVANFNSASKEVEKLCQA